MSDEQLSINNPKNGLSFKEAKKRLEKFGPNTLPEKPPPSNLSILIAQIKNPLVYILFAAGVVTFILKEIPDTIIIFIAVLTNTILSFIQERKASRALHALKKIIHPKAKVVRDGKEVEINVERVVPGDIVVLIQGEKVPADGVLIEANRLFLDEAILTGESVPVVKTAKSLKLKTKDEKQEIKSLVYMGTIVSAGRGLMQVASTGGKTEIGKIAISIQEPSEDTPLRKQLAKFSKQLSILVLVLVLFVFFVGMIKGLSISEIFKTSVALAVSSIPEGILVGLTIVLAIGMQRILKRRGLVRHLISAETLGGVTTICIDKTGTLTQGKMQVVDAIGDESDIVKQMVLANDHDDPIVISAFDWVKEKLKTKGSKLKVGKILEKHDRIDSIPFSSENRFFASLHKWDKAKNMIFVNGAPDVLVSWTNMDDGEKRKINEEIERLTESGKRVVALARKKTPKKKSKLKAFDAKENLEWVGILAFSDPVRSGVKQALKGTKLAGINLIVITGDYAKTAVSVMNQVGIKICKDCTMLGKDLQKISQADLSKKLSGKHSIKLFARTTPDQKLKIVEALKDRGEVVAMMGDGVNDAPALKRADIGIVVGEATEVAKESADLVLLDSSFATIVAAIEEGRGIFDNVRKIILYLMSDSFEEIFAVVATIIFGLPLPVTAAQILWINLVSDGFPDMALTIDPKRKGIMTQPPRSPKESLVASWMRSLIIIVSGVGGLMAFLVFLFFYKTTDSLELSRSMAFATLGVNSLVYVFSIRTLTEPFWKQNPFANKWLNLSVLAGLFLQVVPFTTSRLREFFGVTTLTFSNWTIVFMISFLMFIIIEFSKMVFKKALSK